MSRLLTASSLVCQEKHTTYVGNDDHKRSSRCFETLVCQINFTSEIDWRSTRRLQTNTTAVMTLDIRRALIINCISHIKPIKTFFLLHFRAIHLEVTQFEEHDNRHFQATQRLGSKNFAGRQTLEQTVLGYETTFVQAIGPVCHATKRSEIVSRLVLSSIL
jgi:hypothetical protein